MTIAVLTGATASGKTAVALELAARRSVRLVSVDSAMVYRQMDIGTAKPDRETLVRFPHALVDIRDPAEPYTVADFVADADAAVQAALNEGCLPLLVGGTMMYLQAFRRGLDEVPRSTPEVRQAVAADAAAHGWGAMHERLRDVDPVAAAGIHPNNPQRLARALEVFELTGKPISSFWGRAASAAERHGCPLVELQVDVPRAVLHERIGQRLEQMVADGFIEEVAALRARGDLHTDLPALRAVGYRQVWRYLEGEIDEAQMRADVLAATRGLARRQATWLRRWDHIERLSGADAAALSGHLERLAFA